MKRSEILEIKRLKNDGMSVKEIAAQKGVDPITIYRWLRKLKEAGHVIKNDKPGPKPIDLTEN